jgi:EAL domain-containing protein (putative c-di-GMP-specific phosphodiesterase class I)
MNHDLKNDLNYFMVHWFQPIYHLINNNVIGYEALLRDASTKELQTRGIKIAVDDMGTGYSSFQQWIELEPDFIKLDRYFVKDLSANSRKQDTVRSLLSLFSGTTKVISEGIETIEDLYSVKQLGVSYAQGYFLGMPSPKENLFID